MASSLAAAIEKKFGITAKLKEGHNSIYEVAINGNVVYTNQSACGQFPTDEEIFQEIRKYKDPLPREEGKENMMNDKLRMADNDIIHVAPKEGAREAQATSKVLNVDLLAIDLNICQRCVPTADQLGIAVGLLNPVADALGIELRYREIVVQTPEQAKECALLSSPTIRLNGRDIVQDIRESKCESCGEVTNNNTSVDCREWHYRGEVYFAAPLPLLIESIMGAMLNIDTPPIVISLLEELPENLKRFFESKRGRSKCCGPSSSSRCC